MSTHLLRTLAFAAFTFPALAQAGNEIVFVGTSTSGSTDTHAFVASGTGTIVWQGSDPHTDNVTDAVWADTGRNLYVGQSLMNRVSRAEWDGSMPTWSTFYQGTGACYGLGLDAGRRVLWVLTGSGSSNRELLCLDADTQSPTYGAVLAQTSALGGAMRERWALSPSGNYAAVPYVFPGLFEIVDTNPTSPTFLQVVVSTSVPNASAAGFALASDCEVSIDDQYAYMLYTGIGSAGLAVLDLVTQTLLDFDATAPGQQDFEISLSVPNTISLAIDRSFAVVSGQGGGGWALRIDFDYANPSNTFSTQFTTLGIPNANGISMSPEFTRAAVTSNQQFLTPPGALVIFDVQNGAMLHNVVLPGMWNIYTTAWQDASPTASYTPYGAGCAGTAGVPTLDAAPGSRPALGTTFSADVENLPFAVAVVSVGLSDFLTSGGLPLPVDLGVIGMPGCMLHADPLVLTAVVGSGTSATWSWLLPSTPGLFGARFYNQAFSLDPAANAFGFTSSNAAVGVLGF